MASIKEGGYLLLQVSQGEAEYRATLSDPSRPCELWDSRNLVAGDLYSVLVLVPGLYSVTNELSGTQARMHVQYGGAFGSDRSGAAVIAPVYVTCREKGFDPPQWQVTGVQPVVLAAEAAANFAIYLQQRTQDDKSKEQRLAEEREHLLRALAERKKRRRQKA